MHANNSIYNDDVSSFTGKIERVLMEKRKKKRTVILM